MSSDSRPSFRGFFKEKIKKGMKPNITSSIRERLMSNETYQNVRDKYHNLTDNVKERTGLDKLINKTKSLLPGVFSSKDNDTSPKGFFDSIFSPQTEEDVYLKVAIICLWTIAIVCIIPTIITIFIPARKKPSRTTGVKMIFFHIFLCEFFYLLYILLSMINVAQEFQLNAFFCDLANYGMYTTIPIMHFALLFLSIERITKLCQSTMTWTKIFTKAYVVQVILVFVWFICIAIITTIMLLKKQLSFKSILSKATDIAPPIFQDIGKKISSPYRCSIDGRLSSIFKILFIILFIILLVLLIKSVVVSIFYNFFTPTCCTSKGKKKKYSDLHITLLYVIFLLLNLFFSFPFYFVSIAHTIFTQFSSTKETFSMKLKICFVLRLTSIILQCIAFSTIESNSWSLLRSLLYRGTCKKFPVLQSDTITTQKSSTIRRRPKTDVDSDTDNGPKVDNNEIVINESKSKLLNTRKSGTTRNALTDEDESDDDKPIAQKSTKSNGRKDITVSSRPKSDESEEEQVPTKKPTSKYSSTNGTSKHIPNGKAISQEVPVASTKPKMSRSDTTQNNTKHRSTQLSSSSDEIPDINVNSDDKVKTSTTRPRMQLAIHSSVNEPTRTTTVLLNDRRSHHQQQHRTRRSQASRPTATASSHRHYTKITNRRKPSPRNVTHRSKKLKEYRPNKVPDDSDEV